MDGFFSMIPFEPNIVYLALLIGLWLAVTSVYVPGTGIVEVLAFVLIAFTVLWMATLPVNWLAVIVMVGGAAVFLVVPFVAPEYAIFADAGLLFQAVGGYLLFAETPVSPVIIGVTVVVAWLYNRMLLVPTMQAHRLQTASDEADDVLGRVGRVVKPLDPTGTINVNSELWTARTRDGETLDAGTPVIVLERSGLELTVEKAKRDEPTDRLRMHNGTSDA